EPERLDLVRKMILAAHDCSQTPDEDCDQEFHIALEQLEQYQRADFEGIFRAMEGRPAVIRLLDPPLHEFLPSYEELLEEVIRLRLSGNDPERLLEKEKLLAQLNDMREVNPMLGLRGCRLGLKFPAIYEMQVRAIVAAACNVVREGGAAHPEIMVPLVSHGNEMRVLRENLESTIQSYLKETGCTLDYQIGTMIEVPRAALTADEIAETAEFFSFGTNDLTQTTYGYSRDDAEGKFLMNYLEQGIIPEDPFQVLDRNGVGELIKIGVKLGKQTRPDLTIGICGEHGGDPSSIEFCHIVGLDYVSCSPYRVPVARLAAAQAALNSPAE
ncbi:MAG: pyruvate, phosphate dikinase, partial [Chloroflexi bacterium]|nr:pyruvate, phosphate dikinase [Chloroflexota bacterium]